MSRLEKHQERVPSIHFGPPGSYIIDTTADATPPAVIASFPCSGCEESLEFEHNSTKRNNTVMLYLSEDSFGVDGPLAAGVARDSDSASMQMV